MKVSLFDREKAVTAREQRCGHRGRDSVYPGACCVRRCSLFLLQEGQTAMWTLGKTRDVSQACGPPSFSHFWLPSLLSHKGPPPTPNAHFPLEGRNWTCFYCPLPNCHQPHPLLQFSLSKLAPKHQSIHPKRPSPRPQVANLSPPSSQHAAPDS